MKSPNLAFAGIITFAFGFFLQLAGLPFGFAFFGAGVIMIILSFIVRPGPTVGPEDPHMILCWFCMREIPKGSETCPYCRLKQDSARKD